MPGPHSHADQYTAEVQCVAGDGILERQKQSDDLRSAREFEI